MLKCKLVSFFLVIFFLVFFEVANAQTPPVPDGRRLREIVEDKYPKGKLLIGGTSGQWAFGKPTGIIMDREYSYVTPENDFKQHYVHPDNSTWRWQRPDAWINHVVANDQILRMHGPVSPQCSNWAQNDIRTPQELEINMRAYMEELCKRYNGKTNFLYLDVVNEVVHNGEWKKDEEGVGGWEMPWFIIGQDNDKNKTPLFIKYAFQIATEHAPDISLIINQHEGTIEDDTWDLIKETVQYLRDSSLRVDGIGWQAHVDVGWEKIEGQQDALRDLIDWAHAYDLDFHITECNVFLDSKEPGSFIAQAETFKAIVDIAVEKSVNGLVTWNTWNIDDGNAWREDRYPTLFDDNYRAKPAYYAVQLALEAKGDYTTKHNVKLNVGNTESGEAIQDCQVTFNNETKMTNESGEAEFRVTAGFYDVIAEKRHYGTKSFSNRSVYSDTVFAVSLDSAEVIYNVKFRIEDESTGENLSAVKIELKEQEQTTGIEGESRFTLNPGNYVVQFSKTNYAGVNQNFTIQSDTTFVIKLEQSHADIKFRLKEGIQPVNNARVVFGNDTLLTGALGFCIFRSIPVNNEYSYSVEREFYKDIRGSISIVNDTTLNLQMDKTVANVEIQLATIDNTIENPFVILNNDTAWFNQDLIARHYNIPVDTEYTYQILSGNFATYTNSFWLANDTTIAVTMTFTGLAKNTRHVPFRIFPNPADNILKIDTGEAFDKLEITDYSGRIVLTQKINSISFEINIGELSEGFYLVRIWNNSEEVAGIKPFIIVR